MFIKAKMNAGRDQLHLFAYTFQDEEFKILETVLDEAGIEIELSSIDPDRSGRKGRRYSIPASEVSMFGKAVGGSFDKDGAFHAAPPTPDQTYACKEKRMGGRDGSGCEEFTAPDDPAAFIACSLIAGRNGWYFGVHMLGTCDPKKRSRWPW